MSNFSDAVAGAARSGLCQVLGVPEYLNDMLDRVGFFPFTEARRAVPDFWRNLLCDTPAPNPNPPPFTGGQCNAQYGIFATINRAQNSACLRQVAERPAGNFWGPISGISVVQTPGGLNQNIVNLRFTNFGGGGFPMSIPQTSTVPVWDTDSRCAPAFLISPRLTRTDGLPDNCGNPDPIYRPVEPGDVTVNQDITYNNSQGATVTIPVVLVYARAQVDVDANVTIPFTLNLTPTVNFSGTVNLNGEVNIGTVPNGVGTRPKDPRKGDCGDIPETTEPPPSDPTDSDLDPQPDREREETIIGVLVTVTALSNERASLIVQEDNPDIYAPSLGHVQFLCRTGDTAAAWTSDQPVKNRRNLIPCPWSLGAIAVRGTPQPGVTWTLSPIRGYAGVPVEYVTA